MREGPIDLAQSLATIVDDLTVSDAFDGEGIFDSLQHNQKISALHTIAQGLFCQETVPPELTASLEAAVGAVFDRISAIISMELKGDLDPLDDDSPRALSWREFVRAVCRETGVYDDLSVIDDSFHDDWALLVECLEGRILWDRDWEMEEQLDADPDVAHGVERNLGIDDDYFVSVPPDPSDEEAQSLLEELHSLTAEAR